MIPYLPIECIAFVKRIYIHIISFKFEREVIVKKEWLVKTLALGVVILFIGASVSYTSAIRVKNKPLIVDNQVEEDCGCNEVDDRQLVLLEKQIDRLEVYSKLLLILSKHHPEVLEDYEELSNMILTLNRLDKKPICVFLDNLSESYWRRFKIYENLAFGFIYFFPLLILMQICLNLAGINYVKWLYVDYLYNILNCP